MATQLWEPAEQIDAACCADPRLHFTCAGFVLDDNRNDLLMVSCPLPPQAEWDDVMSARMELLAHRGLAPRIFLPAVPSDGKKCDTSPKPKPYPDLKPYTPTLTLPECQP